MVLIIKSKAGQRHQVRERLSKQMIWACMISLEGCSLRCLGWPCDACKQKAWAAACSMLVHVYRHTVVQEMAVFFIVILLHILSRLLNYAEGYKEYG